MSSEDSPVEKADRILGEPGERIEYFAAPAAAHLPAGGAQHLSRQLEDGFAFRALCIHSS